MQELNYRRPALAGRRLVSIYFGGGTPSLWPSDELAAVIAAVRLATGAEPVEALEITLEANPDDCVAERLTSWRSAGINRLSIGAQSLADRELRALGRDHSAGQALRSVSAARAAGFSRISCDFIVGTPATGCGPLRLPAELVAEVGHLSVYELTVEARTTFGARLRKGQLVPESEERLTDLYVRTHELLAAQGYQHYEISSYAQPGHRAVHNSLYWRGVEYLGIGCAAASFERFPDGGAQRRTNHRSVRAYLAAPVQQRVGESERLDAAEVVADLLWLGLRTADGVPESLLSGRPELRSWLLTEQLAERRDGHICPTLRGFLYADRVASRVIG